MSSAFFRRPTEGSSSSSSDGDSSGEDDVPPHQLHESVEEGQTIITESLSSHGTVSFGDEMDAPATSFPNIDQHRTNLLSALLEDFARNRACEIMNNARPGSRFTKLSAEVQPLADKLYEQLSQSLSLTGVLSAGTDRDNEQTRAAYLAGLESLALGGVQTHDLLHGPARSQLPPLENQLAIKNVDNQPHSLVPTLLAASMTNLALHGPSRLSPYSDLVLSTPTTRRSHYESSFQQLRLLGKGGFGRVYHAYNLFDKKEYAIKKIPLSPRLSQRYRESGHKELENILREVQALAQLEHNNVVRYHATWIEEPRGASTTIPQLRKQNITVQGRRLITDRPAHSRPADRNTPANWQVSDHGDGIVFGFDSRPTTPAQDLESAVHPTRSISETDHDQSSARASEIFTDGNARASIMHDPAMDDSVYVLHVQMSVYPMTLAQYLAPAPPNARSAPSNPIRRHCFHLIPALRLLMGILCGLQYIHAKGLVHRDIKPSNIFISSLSFPAVGLISDGYYDVGSCIGCANPTPYYINPRIGDFGLVAQLAKEDDLETSNHGQKAGKMVGTEYYRPPPWIDSKGKTKSNAQMDEKVDVFALGVIFVELLWPCLTSTERMHVLRDLQKGRTPTGLAEKIDNEGHESGTGEMVVRCISGMLERDPRRRWRCEEIKQWLDKLLTRFPTLVDHGSNGGISGTEGVDMRKVHSFSEANGEAGG
ncbi:eukaryotic translation initiation factor 2-alpha kinase [Fonsecaea erecta]|uniref:Eukaryotic translation initiation factor 2-alpha kinase n=1 Tax=Fonsecaea erecta TaxID=1367422 RepID=A0A179A0S2_9EURO|nr:eukaryotic translation initiation factor 2-alpha kinase [Fonsecaea erecta]OAP64825.1 eukaryotic translation initiation factor 2-alpha kinase [Fonsecaea erecta]